MASTNVNFQMCATCVNWGGSKKADYSKTWIKYNESEQGFCPVLMCERQATNMCGSWEALFDSN